MNSKLLLINKDTKTISVLPTSFSTNEDLSLSIDHWNLAERNGTETLGFTFNVSNATVPQITVSEFCLVVREKISLNESHKNEYLAAKSGKTMFNVPKPALQENSGFIELKDRNG